MPDTVVQLSNSMMVNTTWTVQFTASLMELILTFTCGTLKNAAVPVINSIRSPADKLFSHVVPTPIIKKYKHTDHA